MKIPDDAIIPPEKLTGYLLVAREWDDKSKFLAQAGFDRREPEQLLLALRQFARTHEVVQEGTNEYGEFLRVEGTLPGPNGRSLEVITIWLRWFSDGRVRFVTLKPRREKRQ